MLPNRSVDRGRSFRNCSASAGAQAHGVGVCRPGCSGSPGSHRPSLPPRHVDDCTSWDYAVLAFSKTRRATPASFSAYPALRPVRVKRVRHRIWSDNVLVRDEGEVDVRDRRRWPGTSRPTDRCGNAFIRCAPSSREREAHPERLRRERLREPLGVLKKKRARNSAPFSFLTRLLAPIWIVCAAADSGSCPVIGRVCRADVPGTVSPAAECTYPIDDGVPTAASSYPAPEQPSRPHGKSVYPVDYGGVSVAGAPSVPTVVSKGACAPVVAAPAPVWRMATLVS